MNLKTLIQSYKRNNQRDKKQEFDTFKNITSIVDAIVLACMPENASIKSAKHQRRITKEAKAKAKTSLLENINSLNDCTNFYELHKKVKCLFGPINGLGDLYIYDISFRIGAYFQFKPEFIYLHRGTKIGAKNLGLNYKKPYLKLNELPNEAQILKPYELEDFLCIYKDELHTTLIKKTFNISINLKAGKESLGVKN